jgi:LAO/AO transport system kinase
VDKKAHRAGAAQAAGDLRAALGLGPHRDWNVPILRTVASTGAGVEELADAIDRHRAHRQASGAWRSRRLDAARRRVAALAEDRLRARLGALLASDSWAARLERVAAGDLDPRSVAELVLEELQDGAEPAAR